MAQQQAFSLILLRQSHLGISRSPRTFLGSGGGFLLSVDDIIKSFYVAVVVDYCCTGYANKSSSSDIDFGGEERPPWSICVLLWSAAHVFYVYMEWPGHHIGCMQLQGFKPLLFNQDLLSYLVFFSISRDLCHKGFSGFAYSATILSISFARCFFLLELQLSLKDSCIQC